MGADFLFVSGVPFFVVFVFREIDVQLVFSSHRAWWSVVVGYNYII